MSYQHMDHAEWVEGNNRSANRINANRKAYRPAPEKLSPFQARVMDICGMVFGGIYNAPITWEKVEWDIPGNGISLTARDHGFATFDFAKLTRLVLLCHEARIRGDIEAATRGIFRMMFWQRSHVGGMATRHPDINEAVAEFREYLPADHRVIYRAPELRP